MEASPEDDTLGRTPRLRTDTAHWLESGADAALFSDLRWQELAERLQLTPRQLDIAKGICSGHTYKSIAAKAGIAVNTVCMHVRGLYAKLDAHDRLCAVLRIIHVDKELRAAQDLRRASKSRLSGM